MVDPPSVAYVEEMVDSVTAVWYVSRVAMDISDSVPSGSLVYVTVCPLMTEESPEPLVDWGSDGGVAGKTLSGVSLGSGDGLMVRIDEREGGESIEEWLDLITEVLYSSTDLLPVRFSKGSLPRSASVKPVYQGGKIATY